MASNGFICLLTTILRRAGRVNKDAYERPMVAGYRAIGDVGGTRQVMGINRPLSGVVSIMLPSRGFLRFFRYMLVFDDRLCNKFFRGYFRLVLNSATRNFMPFVRASVLELIGSARGACLKGLYCSNRRCRSRMLVNSFGNEVGKFRCFPIVILRRGLLSVVVVGADFHVWCVRGEFIVFVGRGRHAPPYLFVDPTGCFGRANSCNYVVKVLTVGVFPISWVTFGNDLRGSKLYVRSSVGICARSEVLVPILFRSISFRSNGRVFTSLRVANGNACRRTFTGAT